MNPPQYRKLRGRGRTWAGTARLWMGSDHVLMVQSAGYAETYKRFFLADIQAIVVSKTHAGKIWNGIWGTLALLFALLAISIGDVGGIIMGSIAGLFLLCVVWNSLLGPTCKCEIRTAVQTEQLTALSRLRTAQRLLAELRPLITAAQGELSGEQLAAEFDRRQTAVRGLSDGAPPVIA